MLKNRNVKCMATYVSPSTYNLTQSLADRLGMSKARLLNRALELVIDNPQILIESVRRSVGKNSILDISLDQAD